MTRPGRAVLPVSCPPQASRYLTAREKSRELTYWDAAKASPRPAGELGGLGYVDPEMIEFCDRLNQLAGICTLQSCAGHRLADDYLMPGHLWLRLARTPSEAFRRRCFDLARDPMIEDLSVLYREDGREIVSIIFQGDERGSLAKAQGVIDRFFISMSHRPSR